MINFGNIERRPYLGSREIGEVWLGSVKVYPDNSEPPVPDPYEGRYLTFTFLENGNFGFTKSANTLEYSVDGGTRWLTASAETDIPVLKDTNVMVRFTNPVLYKENTTSSYTDGVCNFYSDCSFNVSGNIMSLIYGGEFEGKTELPSMKDNYGNTVNTSHFYGLFNGCNKLVSAENLILPATTLTDWCYGTMFYNCTNLVAAPKLQSTTLANSCYSSMFRDCQSLTTAPELPATTLSARCYENMFQGSGLVAAPRLTATTLADYCYGGMFNGCETLTSAPSVLPATTLKSHCYQAMFSGTSITKAPELPATTLTNSCYHLMFQDCTSLNYVKCMATDISASFCTNQWLRNVASEGTFVKSASMTSWTAGYDGIPEGWTTVNA